ncbi:P-loop containing nucleoside triphosphate hydrolase protein [Biscogniauxia mediterranea]|nr:P-loop containing nucleoside triphosphate hydrolase protein [Biscogniauxia mediterranea]
MTQDKGALQPSEPLGKMCQFKAYHETVKGGVPSSQPISDPFGKVNNHDDDSTYALVIKRTFEENKPTKTCLQVNSPLILEAFRKVIQSYAPVPSDFNSPLELSNPFQMLAHYWDELDEYRHQVEDAESREHLDLLFEFMEHEIKPDRDRALKMLQKNQIAYENAWFIYRPGEILYIEMMGEPWLLACKKTAYDEDEESGPYFQVYCQYTDHNGTFAGDAEHLFTMVQRDKFPAEDPVHITDLPVYPLRFAVNRDDSLEQRLTARGQRFLALQNCYTASYDGPAEWLKKPPSSYYKSSPCSFRGVWLPYTDSGRVVLDRKTFSEDHRLGQAQVKLAQPKPWLCPPFTIGYSLGRKQWSRLLVDNISDVDWNEDAWDDLVLPDTEKLLLRSLITSHEFSRQPRDLTKQKGKGLVILLHGTPGSGKTLTAETAAEGTKKALISTSVGELNRDSSVFSGSAAFVRELRKCLQYATTWQAVVLLDEADVFLEARRDNSSDRNSLVATFLKELEYFGGIVFLTTNRVKSFDIAMKSRIHLSLGYHPPEAEVRERIWHHYLKAIPEGMSDVSAESAMSKLVVPKLNGREIANVINTARTMARFENTPLKLSHLEKVLKVHEKFDESLLNGTWSV